MLIGSSITTERRYVAAPWDHQGAAARSVGFEDHVEPDPAVVDLYRSAFPDRFIQWDAEKQLFAIYREPDSADEPPLLVEYVFWWDAEPDDDHEDPELHREALRRCLMAGVALDSPEAAQIEADVRAEQEPAFSDEDIAEMVERRDPRIRRRFMAFDEPFVRRRIREKRQFLSDGVRKYNRRIQDRNAARKAAHARKHGGDMAAALGEARRWIPVLEEFERTGRMHAGGRTAMVAGADLTTSTST